MNIEEKISETSSQPFQIPDGIIAIDGSGKIIALNDSAEKITGYKEDEFLSKKIYDVVKSDKDKKIIFNTIRENNSFSNISLELLCAGEKKRNVLASLTPLEQTGGGMVGAIIVFHDSEEINYLFNNLREKTKELNSKSNLLETIFNCRQEGIFSINKNWEITSFNKKAIELTGYTLDEVIGKKCWEIFKTKNCHNGCHMASTIKSAETNSTAELFITNKENKKIPVRVSTSPIYDSENVQVGAIETIQDMSELFNLTSHIEKQFKFNSLVGKSKTMKHAYNLIESVIGNDSTVLISGESGTGKDIIARSIHLNSERKAQPFLIINCNALPEYLLESELFGYEKGAFEGAYVSKPGKFELAKNGTIFLDEVDELSTSLQVKLLRVLEHRAFERIGGTETLNLNARIIAAASKNLEEEMKNGRFREDFFYRISVININLPPLRDRLEDLPSFVNYFLENLSSKLNREPKNISTSVFRILRNYNWPGNIRELENVLEHAFIISNGSLIEPEHLPERLWTLLNKSTAKKEDDEEYTLKSAEKLIIIKNLRKFKGHRGKTAKALGIDRTSLWRKMKKYNLLN